ncbi:MAG: hypothetical protein BWY82_01299 [Verrucomicrobia bacterium ADurb.Bin474]|nr:MAG: hypothetical protein BWY82_01299 [Verrucomicrobia bacterium ADurb.Bin474]
MVDKDRVALHPARDVGADAVGVGVHAGHLLLHGAGVVGEKDGIAAALAHLGLAVGADEGRHLAQEDVGNGKDLAVEPVKAPRNLPGDLHVGLVVLAHGHQVGPGQEDVGRLEHGVAQQAKGHDLQAGVAGHVLQAGHPFSVTTASDAWVFDYPAAGVDAPPDPGSAEDPLPDWP